MHSMDRYAEIRKQTARVRERPLLAAPKIPNELELQARWFAGEFAENSKRLLENWLRSFSLVFGIARPVPIFRMLPFDSPAGQSCAARSKSICSIAIGNCTAMLLILRSTTLFCTFF